MSISSTTVNVLAGAAALVASTGLFMVSPFTQDPPSELPPPPMEVVCASVEISGIDGAPILRGCQYQGYPVAIVAPSPTPF